MNYDFVIVGSGFAGSVLAHEMALIGKRVLVVEKRNHIAGNMYDEYNEDGILVQRYGPHSFHTTKPEIFEYVSQFAEMKPFQLTYRAIVKGIPVPCPFNFTTIRMLYSGEAAEDLINRLKQAFPGQAKVAIFELLESEDPIIREYAEMLFEEDFRPYTAKQWGRRPEDVDQSIIRRVPLLMSDYDGYFDDPYQCHPVGGYTKMFEKILNHPLISVKTGIDALEHIEFNEDQGVVSYDGSSDFHVIFTGPIDELFDCQFGALPYRSLHFEYESLPVDSYQETPIVAHPKNAEFTRITEYKKIPVQNVPGKTLIAREYSVDYDKNAEIGNEPYYPIGGPDNRILRDKYLDLVEKYRNLTTCGRLADYKYYNMDDAIKRALEVSEKLKNIKNHIKSTEF